MALFKNRFGSKSLRALGALVVCGGLMGVGGEAIGDGHDFTLRGGAVEVSITYGTTTEATYTLGGAGDDTFDPVTLGSITSGFASNIFTLVTDITADDPALRLGGAFINTGASGEFRIEANGVAGRIDFTDTPAVGRIGLQNIDTITIDGGTANTIRAVDAEEGVTFNLLSGTITSNVVGSREDDTFIIGPDIRVSGRIDGGDGMDTLRLADGFAVSEMAFDNDTLTLMFNDTFLEFDIRNIEDFILENPIMRTFATTADIPDEAARMGASGRDVFIITGDVTGGALIIDGVIDGLFSTDELQLNAGAVVNDVRLINDVPTGGDVNLQSFEIITINGGTVNGDIDASRATADTTFNLEDGTITGDVIGGGGDDTFVISSRIRVSGMLDGGSGIDTLSLTSDFVGSANFFNNVLTLIFGGNRLDFMLRNIETFAIADLTMTPETLMRTFERGTPPQEDFTGAGADDVFMITGDATGNTPALMLVGVIDGAGGDDELQLNTNAVVASVAFSSNNPTEGAVHLQNVEIITLDGGRVNGAINASDAGAGVTFNLVSGVAGNTHITGSDQNDIFTIAGDITGATPLDINGLIRGGNGRDEVQLITGGIVNNLDFNSLTDGNLSVRNVETITIDGGTVNVSITGSNTATTFNLLSGMIGSNVIGGDGDDTFVIGSGITVSGMIDGSGGTNTVSLTSDFVGSANFFNNVLTLTFGGNRLEFMLMNIEPAAIDGLTTAGEALLRTFTTTADIPTPADRMGGEGNDVFIITGDATDGTLMINGVINGLNGDDELQLNDNAVVGNIRFTDTPPTSGDVHLQNFETLSLNGGTVNGVFNARGANTSVTFNLISGTANDDILGSSRSDIFTIAGNITGNNPALAINGVIDGRNDIAGNDVLMLNAGAIVNDIAFSNQAPDRGDLHLQDIEAIRVEGGTVGNIDASATANRIRVDLASGTVTGDVIGSVYGDTFIFNKGFTLEGSINGGLENDIGGGVAGDAFGLGEGLSVTSLHITEDTTFVFAGGDAAELPAMTGIERFQLAGGTITGDIDISAAPANVVLILDIGTIGGNILGSNLQEDYFFILNDITGATPTLAINGVIDGRGGHDTIDLRGDAIVGSIVFSDQPPTGGALHLQNFESIRVEGGRVRVNGDIDASAALAGVTFNLVSRFIGGNVIGSNFDDDVILRGDITGDDPILDFKGVIDGRDGSNGRGGSADRVDLRTGAVVESIAFSNQASPGGALHLQNIIAIRIRGGIVNGDISARAARAGVQFILSVENGSIGGNVIGSNHDDGFQLYSTINIGGYIDGGAGIDFLAYAGAEGTDTPARSGLAPDPDITDDRGSVRNTERQFSFSFIRSLGTRGAGGGGLSALTVRGIEVLSLSPALNLYGALSDALMQFGAQTAQGFGLADLNLASGRATSLVSKDSPFTKGRIWAHKITHAGNGKGSIGLGLTGLTARADSDYNFEMSLTQHGFDAPVAATKLGAFNLRAVSHTMTGTIETNVAEAKVSGYGAGVALLWGSDSLSAHITSLASAYEVEATTSSLNPQAVVNEVSEGSFSAINAVVSAGLADKRELAYGLSLRTTADVSWQTLSLDDFSETGARRHQPSTLTKPRASRRVWVLGWRASIGSVMWSLCMRRHRAGLCHRV